MSSPDPQRIHELLTICMNKVNVKYRELWIYPSKKEYRVEILPNPNKDQVVEITECLKNEINTEASVESRPYGVILRIFPRVR